MTVARPSSERSLMVRGKPSTKMSTEPRAGFPSPARTVTVAPGRSAGNELLVVQPEDGGGNPLDGSRGLHGDGGLSVREKGS